MISGFGISEAPISSLFEESSSITFDAAFAAWTRSAERSPVVLVEIDYVVEVDGAPVTSTLYFATKPYVSSPTDVPAKTPYVDCVAAIPSYTRTMDRAKLYGGYSVSFGSVELTNVDGEYDEILRYAYDGSEVRVYVGDESWAKADFRLVFIALGEKAASSTSRLVFSIKDTSTLLNANLSSYATVGGTGPNANAFQPINLGMVHNVEFLVSDVGSLIYRYGNSTTDAVVLAVRDKGSTLTPVSEWVDNGDGTVTLSVTPVGLITGDVFELPTADPDAYRISNFITSLAGDFGGLFARDLFYGAHSSFTVGDSLDHHAGLSLRDSSNFMPWLQLLAESGNCFYAVTRLGKFYYGRIYPYDITGDSVMTITDDDIVPKTAIKVEELIPLYDQIQCTGNKNWKQQSDFALGVDVDDIARYSRAGYAFTEPAPSGTAYVDNPRLYHKTMAASPTIETLISLPDDVGSGGSGADDELEIFAETRRLMLLSWVQIVDLTMGLEAATLEIGDAVMLQSERFGFNIAKKCQVIGVGIRLDKERVDLTLVHRQPAVPSFMLREDGSYILREDGSRFIHVH